MDLSALGAPHSHPSSEELQQAVHSVAQWALAQHAAYDREGEAIGRHASPAEVRQLLAEPPPETGQAFNRVLDRFATQINPFAFHGQHPRFVAFVPGAPSFASILGDWLSSASNIFCGAWFEAAGPAQVELTVIEWFKTWLGLPSQASGLLTSGGSEANLTALIVARDRIPFAERGRCILYASDQRHWSIDRAVKIIGLHSDQVRTINTGADLRMSAAALTHAVRGDRASGLRPWAVVGNMGATNAGTVDPLEELAAVCREQDLWFHVDAAYGWAAVLSSQSRSLCAGIEQADSITLDPHKWMAQTFEAGCVIVRNGHLLEETFAMRPDYLQDVEPQPSEVNFADRGIALTRSFRALKIWFSVQTLGAEWFRTLVERGIGLAAYAQQLLENARFEILQPAQLSVVCFRYFDPMVEELDLEERNRSLARELLARNVGSLSTTRLHGIYALRMCFVNWRTTATDVVKIVEALTLAASSESSG